MGADINLDKSALLLSQNLPANLLLNQVLDWYASLNVNNSILNRLVTSKLLRSRHGWLEKSKLFHKWYFYGFCWSIFWSIKPMKMRFRDTLFSYPDVCYSLISQILNSFRFHCWVSTISDLSPRTNLWYDDAITVYLVTHLPLLGLDFYFGSLSVTAKKGEKRVKFWDENSTFSLFFTTVTNGLPYSTHTVPTFVAFYFVPKK